ncbi:MAG: YncE family protein [Parachlamydiales bacterium]|nr:YncE family protein [Parachlamydiales bacterium]
MIKYFFLLAFAHLCAVDCQLLVAGFTTNTLSSIDIATGTGVTIPAGMTPVGVTISKDHQQAYVLNNTGDSVFIYSLATTTPTMIGMIPLPALRSPQTLTVSPSGVYGYIANQAMATISVVNLQMQTFIQEIPLPGVGSATFSAIGNDGKLYVVGVASKTLSQLLLTGMGASEMTPVFVGNYPLPPASMSPADFAFNGNIAYIANQGSPNLSTVDVSVAPPGTSALIPIPGAGSLIGLVITHGYAYVTDNANNLLWSVNLGTNSPTSFPLTGSGPLYEVLSSDGNTAYIANVSSNDISVFDVSSSSGIPVQQLPNIPIPAGTNFPLGIAITPCASNPTNNVTARAHVTSFFWQSDVYNALSWAAAGTNTVTYKIYRNGILAGETSSTTFEDHYLNSKTTYNYSIYAVDSGGTATLIGTATVTTGKG